MAHWPALESKLNHRMAMALPALAWAGPAATVASCTAQQRPVTLQHAKHHHMANSSCAPGARITHGGRETEQGGGSAHRFSLSADTEVPRMEPRFCGLRQ